jgi:hypothetical protein
MSVRSIATKTALGVMGVAAGTAFEADAVVNGVALTAMTGPGVVLAIPAVLAEGAIGGTLFATGVASLRSAAAEFHRDYPRAAPLLAPRVLGVGFRVR